MHLLAQHYLANIFLISKDIDASIKTTNRKYKWANVYSYLGHPLMEKIPILDTWYQVLIKVSNPIFDPTYCREKAEVSSKARKEGQGVETDQWHRLLLV